MAKECFQIWVYYTQCDVMMVLFGLIFCPPPQKTQDHTTRDVKILISSLVCVQSRSISQNFESTPFEGRLQLIQFLGHIQKKLPPIKVLK